MSLLLAYVIVVLVGQSGVIAITLLVDRWYGSGPSLMLFFILFFGMIWLAWRISVRLTQPKTS